MSEDKFFKYSIFMNFDMETCLMKSSFNTKRECKAWVAGILQIMDYFCEPDSDMYWFTLYDNEKDEVVE